MPPTADKTPAGAGRSESGLFVAEIIAKQIGGRTRVETKTRSRRKRQMVPAITIFHGTNGENKRVVNQNSGR
jgi:hypothetical protein